MPPKSTVNTTKMAGGKLTALPTSPPLRPSTAAARVWAIPHLRQAIVSHFDFKSRGRLLLNFDCLATLIRDQYYRITVDDDIQIHNRAERECDLDDGRRWSMPWTTRASTCGLLLADTRVDAVYRADIAVLRDIRLSVMHPAPSPDEVIIKKYMSDFPRLQTLHLRDGELQLVVTRLNGSTAIKGAVTCVNLSPKAIIDKAANIIHCTRRTFADCSLTLEVAIELRLGERSQWSISFAPPSHHLVVPEGVDLTASLTLHLVEDASCNELGDPDEWPDQGYSRVRDYTGRVVKTCQDNNIKLTKVGVAWFVGAPRLHKLVQFMEPLPFTVTELAVRGTTETWYSIVCAFKPRRFPFISRLSLDILTGGGETAGPSPGTLKNLAAINVTVHYVTDFTRERQQPADMLRRIFTLGGKHCRYEIDQTGHYDDRVLDWHNDVEEAMMKFFDDEGDVLHLNGCRVTCVDDCLKVEYV